MRYILILTVLLLMTGSLLAQTYLSTPQFNRAWMVQEKMSYINTTTNDTTKWIPITTGSVGVRAGATDFAVFARSNDSLAALIYYQLKNSDANWTGSWTAIDTAIHVETTDSTSYVGTVLLSTLLGANQVRFYTDYLTGTSTSAAGDGVTNRFRLYVFLKE